MGIFEAALRRTVAASFQAQRELRPGRGWANPNVAKKPRQPWYNVECRRAYERMIRLQRSRGKEAEEYHQARLEYRKKTRRARAEFGN